MNYTAIENNNQIENNEVYLKLPSNLERFVNIETTISKDIYGRDAYLFSGYVTLTDEDRLCQCGCKMYVHNSFDIYLKHIPIGGICSYLVVDIAQLKCDCSVLEEINFSSISLL